MMIAGQSERTQVRTAAGQRARAPERERERKGKKAGETEPDALGENDSESINHTPMVI